VPRSLRHLALAAILLVGIDFPARAAIVSAIEYYEPALDHYFVTSIPAEIAALDGGQFPGWVRTGLSFNVFAAGSAVIASSPVCRFYGSPSAGLDSHFYSASILECQEVEQRFPGIWLLESDDVFEVFLPNLTTGQCPAGSIPIYRAWNNRADSNHRYTTDLSVLQAMLAKGYIAEGYGPGPAPTAMCSPGNASGGGAPVCAPTASDAIPYINTTITLFANCSGAPTSYTWTGCASTNGRCDTTSSVSGTVAYTVVATNASGSSAPAAVSVRWRDLPPPPVCSLIVSTNTVPPVAGSLALLDAACSSTPTGYAWSGCGSSSNLCPAQSSIAGAQTYGVSGINAGGVGPAATTTLNWQGGTPPPPGLCGQYPSYLFSDFGWVGAEIFSRDYTDAPGFAWNGVWVVKISIPVNATGTSQGNIEIAEFGGPPTAREVTVSRVACDFRPDDPTGNNGPFVRSEGNSASIGFTLGAGSGGVPGLLPGVDYYVNIRNWQIQTSQISCDPSIRCDALFILSLPR
jgi:hypothetical protein